MATLVNNVIYISSFVKAAMAILAVVFGSLKGWQSMVLKAAMAILAKGQDNQGFLAKAAKAGNVYRGSAQPNRSNPKMASPLKSGNGKRRFDRLKEC
jgi:hypothetical protein